MSSISDRLKSATIMGETFESWGEILRHWLWLSITGVFRATLFFGAIFAVVKFVKWAWFYEP